MQKHYNYITIDLDKKIYTKPKAVQGDSKSRYILVNLIDNNLYYDLSGTTVKVYGLKKDKKIFFNDATIVDATKGQFEIELTNQALAVAGDLKVQILILGPNQEKLSTFSFFIEVVESIIDDAAIESSNEFKALTTSLSKVEEWNGYFEETSGKIEEKYTERLNNLDEQFNTKANEIDLVVERKRIDNLIALPENASINDARLEDICIGNNGVSYDSPGNSIRSQLNYYNNLLSQLTTDSIIENNFKQGFYDSSLKSLRTIAYDDNWGGSQQLTSSAYGYNYMILDVIEGEKYKISAKTPASTMTCKLLTFLKSDYSVVSTDRGTSDNGNVEIEDYEFTAPQYAKYLIVSSNSSPTTNIKLTKLNSKLNVKGSTISNLNFSSMSNQLLKQFGKKEFGNIKKGSLVIIDDDGMSSSLNYSLPLINLKNIPICFACWANSEIIVNNLNDLKKHIDNEMLEIIQHGYNNLNELTENELVNFYEIQKSLFKEKGIDVKNIAYPNNNYDDLVLAITNSYFNIGCKGGNTLNTNRTNALCMSRWYLLNNDLNTFKARIDECIRDNKILILYYHGNEIANNESEYDKLINIIDYAKTTSINITTLEKLYNM